MHLWEQAKTQRDELVSKFKSCGKSLAAAYSQKLKPSNHYDGNSAYLDARLVLQGHLKASPSAFNMLVSEEKAKSVRDGIMSALRDTCEWELGSLKTGRSKASQDSEGVETTLDKAPRDAWRELATDGGKFLEQFGTVTYANLPSELARGSRSSVLYWDTEDADPKTDLTKKCISLGLKAFDAAESAGVTDHDDGSINSVLRLFQLLEALRGNC